MTAGRGRDRADERYYLASQWTLMWRKFRRHRVAMVGLWLLLACYAVAAFCEFLAPYEALTRNVDYVYCPPQRLHFVDEQGWHLRPFVYGLRQQFDLQKFERSYTEDTSRRYPVRFLVRGDRYKLWGLWDSDLHLFGAGEGALYLLGTDELGRDMLSRTLYATRVSLSVGVVGVVLSFVLGCVIGGLAGYYGGVADAVVQRITEFLISIPDIPFWLGLSAAVPASWSAVKVYFTISVILSLSSWTGLARIIRGQLLELRQEDFVMAARVAGASDAQIIARHLMPSVASQLIIRLTLSIPWMILAETSLSFLGLGLRPPVVSWGVLLKNAQNFQDVALHPWLLIPGVFVVVVVLAFNFLGDGLRDAADPYR
jgi:peptide/nickel transport system permease protein